MRINDDFQRTGIYPRTMLSDAPSPKRGDGTETPERREHDFVGLLESAERMGGFAWFERELFGLLGSWSTSEPLAADALVFADHARRCMWHSQLWFERLPELAVVDAASLVTAPGAGLQALLDELEAATDTALRLVGAYRVLIAHLLSSYADFADSIDPLAAPSVQRWLGFINSDLSEQWRWGERRLRALLRTPEAVARAFGFQQRLELHLLPPRP